MANVLLREQRTKVTNVLSEANNGFDHGQGYQGRMKHGYFMYNIKRQICPDQ